MFSDEIKGPRGFSDHGMADRLTEWADLIVETQNFAELTKKTSYYSVLNPGEHFPLVGAAWSHTSLKEYQMTQNPLKWKRTEYKIFNRKKFFCSTFLYDRTAI